MTSLPDWLVERAALDEVSPPSRDRLDRVDPRELAQRIAALRDDNAAELAAHPATVAVAQIEARIASEARRRRARNVRWLGAAGALAAAAAALAMVVFATGRSGSVERGGMPPDDVEITRVKGAPRLQVFRHAGDRAERLEHDALVHAGDRLQLRYHAGGERHGVIASIDGAGAVTLHFPASEDAPPETTALDAKTTSLPHAYVLDDAPRFERFFFITADAPLDVTRILASLRAFAQRDDSATASPELAAGLRHWSLRLRKPDRPSTRP